MCWASSRCFGSETRQNAQQNHGWRDILIFSFHAQTLAFIEHSPLPPQRRMLQFHQFRHWFPKISGTIFFEKATASVANHQRRQEIVPNPSKSTEVMSTAKNHPDCSNYSALTVLGDGSSSLDLIMELLILSTSGGFLKKIGWMVTILVMSDLNSLLR